MMFRAVVVCLFIYCKCIWCHGARVPLSGCNKLMLWWCLHHPLLHIIPLLGSFPPDLFLDVDRRVYSTKMRWIGSDTNGYGSAAEAAAVALAKSARRLWI